MALLQNITARSVDLIRYSAYHGCNERPLWGGQGLQKSGNRWIGDAGISRLSGVPDGAGPEYAWLPPLTAGALRLSYGAGGTGALTPGDLLKGMNISGALDGAGGIVGDIEGAGELTSTLSGTSTMTQAFLAGAVLLTASLAGASSLDEADLRGILEAAATLAGSGQLTDANISASVFIAATIAAQASLTEANLAAGWYLAADILAEGGIDAAVIRGAGEMTATIQIGASPSANDIASAIWSAAAALNNSDGTMGGLLNNAGGATDPDTIGQAVWAQLLAENKVSGSFGEFVQKILTVAKFLGLK